MAILAIIIVAAVAFGIYWVATERPGAITTETDTTRVEMPRMPVGGEAPGTPAPQPASP